jgi:hypoxanthine phosphoribosyltransferase
MDKIYYTEYSINEMISLLVCKVFKSQRKFQGVVGIANGGLNISTKVAASLELPHSSVHISFYDGTVKRKEPKITLTDKPTKNVLIVDDLIDEGNTLKAFDEVYGLEGNAVAVLFWNKNSLFVPDFYISEKPNAWIIFPWETM